VFRKKKCPRTGRFLLALKTIMAIEEKVNREFERISIADLMSEKAG